MIERRGRYNDREDTTNRYIHVHVHTLIAQTAQEKDGRIWTPQIAACACTC